MATVYTYGSDVREGNRKDSTGLKLSIIERGDRTDKEGVTATQNREE